MVRRPTPEIRAVVEKLLAEAQSGPEKMSQAAWAASLGLSPTTVSDIRKNKSVSVNRENIVRGVLKMDLIEQTPVLIDPERERIVRQPGHGRERKYNEFKVYADDRQAYVIREMVKACGCKSFSEFYRTVLGPILEDWFNS